MRHWTSRVRIVLLVTDHQPGGAPLRLARLATLLREAGDDVICGCLARPGPVSRSLHDAGFQTFACDAASARDLGAVRRLTLRLREIRPDVVHSTLFHANVAARHAAKRARVPLVTATATIEVERPWHLTLERLTRGWDRFHIVNSRAVADHVVNSLGFSRDQVVTVPPLPPEAAPERIRSREAARAALGLDHAAKVVLWCGRLDPVKRVEWLVAHAARAGSADCQYVLIGEGPDRSRIEALIRAYSLEHRICVAGWRGDVRLWMTAADLLAFPSRTEGMPNTVLEALAAGLPTVAAPIAALRELELENGAVICAESDSAECFGKTLDRLLADPHRAEIGARGREWVKRALSPEAVVAAARRAYRLAISATANKSPRGVAG